MSDRSTAAHLGVGDLSVTRIGSDLPEITMPAPLAIVVVEIASGRVVTASAAAQRLLSNAAAAPLTAWILDVATQPVDRHDATSVHTWGGPGAPDGARAVLSAQRTPLVFRSRDCALVVLRDALTPAAGQGLDDEDCATFTLDAIGRIDAWSAAAARVTGFGPEQTIGSEAGALHPTPARLAGEPHRALTQAFRSGEHRGCGWRRRADGTLLWAEAVTSALYDANDRVVGFAVVLDDLTARRRLQARPARTTRRVPGQQVAAARPIAPTAARRRPPGRVPGQRGPIAD
jgi:PAS domain S-box-containing protein